VPTFFPGKGKIFQWVGQKHTIFQKTKKGSTFLKKSKNFEFDRRGLLAPLAPSGRPCTNHKIVTYFHGRIKLILSYRSNNNFPLSIPDLQGFSKAEKYLKCEEMNLQSEGNKVRLGWM
jgi:hypothetical protein